MDKPSYPLINIRTKNDLAKQISDTEMPFVESLKLINDCLDNFNDYWKDSSHSEPEKGKYVRSAKGSPLGLLLSKIDKKVLAPCDNLVPDFLFGGLSKRSHLYAAKSLIGKERSRVLIGLDISHFFEQIQQRRIFYFFYKKCGCKARASNILAKLCCVPMGPKGSRSTNPVLARGFATSPRLAVWANIDTFRHLKWTVEKKLVGHDPKVAIFVDDIGITASKVDAPQMKTISDSIKILLETFDPNQPLPVNEKKTKLKQFTEGAEHLGVLLGRNKLMVSRKTKSKIDKIKHLIKITTEVAERKVLITKKKAYFQYKEQIKKANQS